MSRPHPYAVLAACIGCAAVVACSSDVSLEPLPSRGWPFVEGGGGDGVDANNGLGGTVAASGSGGALGLGGTTASSGVGASGGSVTGGSVGASGGFGASGGSLSSGGFGATGGSASSGGFGATGGSASSGGGGGSSGAGRGGSGGAHQGSAGSSSATGGPSVVGCPPLAGAAPTWSSIWTTYGFSSSCRSCHKEASSASGAYTWLQQFGQIEGTMSPFATAYNPEVVQNSSVLVLFGGDMPRSGAAINAGAKCALAEWALAGAKNN